MLEPDPAKKEIVQQLRQELIEETLKESARLRDLLECVERQLEEMLRPLPDSPQAEARGDNFPF